MDHTPRRARGWMPAFVAALVLACAPTARATWSIIVYNSRTGEIGVASATCLTNLDLRRALPVVLVGVGAACAQSAIDSGAFNRRFIRDQLRLGTPPEEIIELLEGRDFQHQQRQYGILDSRMRTATFTGSDAGRFANGITGRQGDLHWAIQGNVITGQPVLDKARDALTDTPGDLPDKLLAAMEAARAMGGDGRCSCDQNPPADACGSPPSSFQKSAHIAFLIVARLGDTDGGCASAGCARGEYFLNLNVPGAQAQDPDPVLQLHKQLADWRQTWVGRPDHVLTDATASPGAIPADGRATSTLELRLIDWRRKPVKKGGAQLTVTHADDSVGSSTIGAVRDNGDGTYSVDLTAGKAAGTDVFDVRIDDGLGIPVTLSPKPTLELFAPASRGPNDAVLELDREHISLSEGGVIGFRLEAGPRRAGRPYLLLATVSGTQPGLRLGMTRLPLNPDPVLYWMLRHGNSFAFPKGRGFLDTEGRAEAALMVPVTTSSPWVEVEMSFAYVVGDPFDAASSPVPLRVTD